jgi:ribosomal protein L25 (general stress protein Ctc)
MNKPVWPCGPIKARSFGSQRNFFLSQTFLWHNLPDVQTDELVTAGVSTLHPSSAEGRRRRYLTEAFPCYILSYNLSTVSDGVSRDQITFPEMMESRTMSTTQNSPAPLQATERDDTLNPRQLRTAGFVPATLYGKNIESQSIQVRTVEFTRLYGHGAREFKFSGLKQDIVARVQQVQTNPVTEEVLSIQFYQLSPAGAEKPAKAAKTAEPVGV